MSVAVCQSGGVGVEKGAGRGEEERAAQLLPISVAVEEVRRSVACSGGRGHQ